MNGSTRGCLISLITVFTLVAAPPDGPWPLWPGEAPGERGGIGEEKDTSKPGEGLVAGRPLIRLGNVSKPTLQIFRPPADRDTGASVLVFPGGGYSILALDLEGTEVCDWLNGIGVTGILLKYRVPKREGQPAHQAPLQDAQRAIGLTRHHATAWGLKPDRIGVLGFSAGGNLAALASTTHAERTYPPLDAADAVSCRPDFAILIYPAYLTDKDRGDRIRAELPVNDRTPPTFLSISQDDPVRVETALGYAWELQRHGVPFELHVYPTGGHGYGLRRTDNPVTTWPDRAADWMRASGWLDR
ncbi:MAG: alpha/beta hydrolase [Verrucomicrobiae bacterium]|nr:alpha/beta hydrolase [Verrucomicrobiae bacterium]